MEFEYPRVHHPSLEAFAVLADQFGALVEGHEAYEGPRFITTLHPLLTRLYAAGLELPSVDALFDEGTEEDDVDAGEAAPSMPREDPDRGGGDEWRRLYGALAAKLGDQGIYRAIFDPYGAEEEVTGSLADDTADIYRDLKSGLAKWQRGDSGGALWEWRFGFEAHWGEHAVSALGAIHALAAWYDLPWPDAAAAERLPDGD